MTQQDERATEPIEFGPSVTTRRTDLDGTKWPKPPSRAAFEQLAERYALDLSDAELTELRDVATSVLPGYAELLDLPADQPASDWPRDIGRRPDATDNELNAWA